MRVPLLVLPALLLALIAAAPASADLAPGSMRPMLSGRGQHVRLAMPLPTVHQVPRCAGVPTGASSSTPASATAPPTGTPAPGACATA
jgi:hypothetical protein